MTFTLFFDEDVRKVVEEEIVVKLKDLIDSYHSIDELAEHIVENSNVLLFASDKAIKDLLPIFAEKKCTLSILPHPKSGDLCVGWGVDYKLDKAITHILNLPEPIEIDVLYCNDRPVFNNVVIGEAFQLVTSKNGVKAGFFTKMRELFKRFSRIKPFSIEAQFKDDKLLKTSVSGVVIVQHGKSTLLSRLMLQSYL